MNDFKSILIQVKKSLSSFSGPGRYNNIRKKSISFDLPLSQINFNREFISKIPGIHQAFQVPMRLKLTPADLEPVFGQDWHIFNFRDSKTRVRVLGEVGLVVQEEDAEM